MRIFIVFVMAIVLLSCGEEETVDWNSVQVPDSVISKPVMIKILTEFSLLESARSQNLLVKQDTTTKKMIPPDVLVMQEKILKKYGETKKHYESSFSYYSSQPELLAVLYEEAMNELSQLQARAAH